MKITSLVIAIASIGFIIMGMFILKSKTISKTMITEENSEKSKSFIQKNGYLNILFGGIGLIIAIIESITNEWSSILIIIFVILIFLLSIIQYYLGKNYRNQLK